MKLIQLAQQRETNTLVQETSVILQEWKAELTFSLTQRDAIKSFVAFVNHTTSSKEKNRVLHTSQMPSLELLIDTLLQADKKTRIKQLFLLYFSPESMRIPLLVSIFLVQYHKANTVKEYDILANNYYERATKTILLSDTTQQKPLLRLKTVLQKDIMAIEHT